MTKIINLGTSAFYELQEATKKAKGSFDYNEEIYKRMGFDTDKLIIK